MHTSYNIVEEIDRFQATPSHTSSVRCERIDEFGWLLSPAASSIDIRKATNGKSIGLTLMGLTHGNETAGIAVLNHLLDLISVGALAIEYPVAFILGNPWAAREDKRFLESDLNRSFAAAKVETKEQERARELMPILARSARLVDYHQTTRKCDRAFFIFPYSSESVDFARSFCPEQTIVTHWGSPFSSEGQCTDEYVNDQGGIGISLELGQNGFDPYQIAAGVHAGARALAALAQTFSEKPASSAKRSLGPILTFADVMAWPVKRSVILKPGLDNFVSVEKGDVLGHGDGEPILASATGQIIFAKYLTANEQENLKTRPTELCRIMVPVERDELPD